MITIYFLRENNYFNKVVASYTGNDFLILSLVTITVIAMTYVSKVNARFLSRVDLFGDSRVGRLDWIIMFVISIVFLFYLYSDIHFILGVFKAKDQYAIMALRKISTSAGNDYLFKKVVIEGVFWVSLLYYYSIKERSRCFSLLLYFVTLLFALFLLASLKKVSLVILFVSIFLVTNYNRKLSLIKLFKLLLLFVVFMFAMYSLLIRNVDLEYMLSPFKEGLFGRIFISEISSLYAHMEIFKYDNLGFESISRTLSNILGIDFSPRSGEVVMATVNPSWIEMEIGGTYNTLFLGEAFANFSYMGLGVSIAYVLFYYFVIVRTIVLFPNKFRVPVLVYLSLNVNIMAGFNDYIYNPFLTLIYCSLLMRRLFVSKIPIA
ncbi:hypothetical protein [Vibrio sp. SCSIO 43136]|uniref:hypothetical protein n=1 Tax=Vibrio sp. SCSIO 43136 TaxID=2819101 RepID=UPI0020750FF7|nr:hypothetical protein [Vibrio sp. SCSIO 43136]USD65108.1 hypothetical protein J4N39_13835 [Vibrio sp. SCSIO 43136]